MALYIPGPGSCIEISLCPGVCQYYCGNNNCYCVPPPQQQSTPQPTQQPTTSQPTQQPTQTLSQTSTPTQTCQPGTICIDAYTCASNSGTCVSSCDGNCCCVIPQQPIQTQQVQQTTQQQYTQQPQQVTQPQQTTQQGSMSQSLTLMMQVLSIAMASAVIMNTLGKQSAPVWS